MLTWGQLAAPVAVCFLIGVALATQEHYDAAAGHDVTADYGDGNETDHHGDHNSSEHPHGNHHGVHVASLQLEYVKNPLIVTLFMTAVVICKIGDHCVSVC